MSSVFQSSVSHSAGLALGSNLGNRLAHLRQARDRLRKMSADGLLQAPIYQTAPVACPEGSPDFYNTVVEIRFQGSPQELLAAALSLELELGRDRSAGPNAPRTIDIDLLYFGHETIAEADLELPHPRLTSRRFVLQPLADIRPDLVLPGDHSTIAEHLAHLDTNEPDLALVQAAW
ncbi:2-amino-4-hydroxy-6-hydroxymethyldihydropteridine diphosphokinase [Haloferula sp. A504]|uniref:2-amino-4-hydroxy-6- hydroxymethyldihydropteridine diphosphokinase n=1 Tax=Haloferula sp. A504 TaxID=3373601 RepID=UPI0031BF75C1|nr:2-amino-4-hydroxy-6-hydroxymethyldihydropteridine diphosphokinase [Verrucomicrobiaceae bacterium E54]